MNNTSPRSFVLLPCSSSQSWAVPQQCLGEIVTIGAANDEVPAAINWRGEEVPVLDFGPDDARPWRDPRRGTALVAVVLGLEGHACRYWGIALRGEGLGISALEEEEIEDLPGEALAHALAAFRLHGVVYQVPDLPALQATIKPPGAGGQA